MNTDPPAAEAGTEAQRRGDGGVPQNSQRCRSEEAAIRHDGRIDRVTLSDGKLTHDAQFQAIDVYKPVFRGAEGTVEKNFRDSYKFNIAAFRLGRMIGDQ